MGRKISIALMAWFSIQFVVMLFFYESTSNQIIRAVSLVTIAVGFPFSFALFFLNSKLELLNKVRIIYLIIAVSIVVISFFIQFVLLIPNSLKIFGVLWYCFAYAPLELRSKYNKWLEYFSKKVELFVLSSINFIAINGLLLGSLFYFMHWKGGSFFLIIGIIFGIISPLLWISKFKTEIVLRKKSEDKLKDVLKDITDSINYAKRIQNAILPPQRLVKEYLPQSFILYQPKDVVAGDFYWMEYKNDKLLFAACDCTGHGVPGAMVSVICVNGLNRSVREYNLTEPGKILDKTRDIVITEFEKSDEDVKDGMDISLCCLDFKSNTISWAGANNPLWIIRKGSTQIEEIKANKQPIGKTETPQPFTTHSIEFNEGDTLYIFTDGYQDQFGGEKGKKFKAAQLKELLLSIQQENMENQRKIIAKTFDQWKGNLEQVDDVCIIGVRV
ncbi:MAG: SpoIIE family protein phosphatase [Flavobacteriales bacterium]|nr:SpoIIE family protein phosphatase [Flavobacteriales bacterium]